MESVQVQPCDIISNLPEDIIQKILIGLPTRDAVRTSILSKKWRYRWTKLPKLLLDETLWNESTVKHSPKITIARILYQLLLLHEGPVTHFKLSIPELNSCPEIDNLIFFLSRNGIKYLKLYMWTNERYRLPSSMFTCQQLIKLNLESCLIEIPQSFKGFSQLIKLKLCNVTISTKVLESLISSSPLLKSLELQTTFDYNDLVIDAPKLKTFIFVGTIKSIILKHVPLLSTVCLSFEQYNLVDFFNSLPALESLHLSYLFVKSLISGGVPTSLGTSLKNIKYIGLFSITLDEKLDELSFVSFFLFLIKNSPHLKCIYIRFSFETPSNPNVVLDFLKEQDYSDIILKQLKDVKLKNFTGTKTELELIKLLLAKSPSLEYMLIVPGEQISDKVELKIVKELVKFRRASVEAEVIYVEKEDQV